MMTPRRARKGDIVRIDGVDYRFDACSAYDYNLYVEVLEKGWGVQFKPIRLQRADGVGVIMVAPGEIQKAF